MPEAEPTSKGNGRGPGRPRDRQVDDAILAATRELLTEVGFERLTVTDVALRAGVGRPTVYRRYPSKEALVAASVDALRNDAPAPDTGSLIGDLRQELLPRAVALEEPLLLQFLAMLLVANAQDSEFAHTYWRDAVAARREAFTQVLQRAQARGELSHDLDLDLLVDVVAGSILYQILRPATIRTQPIDERIESLIELFATLVPNPGGR